MSQREIQMQKFIQELKILLETLYIVFEKIKYGVLYRNVLSLELLI